MSARYGEDADAYWGRMEREAKKHPKCCLCEGTIYPGDHYYIFHDLPFSGPDLVCEDCLIEYLDAHGYRDVYDENG